MNTLGGPYRFIVDILSLGRTSGKKRGARTTQHGGWLFWSPKAPHRIGTLVAQTLSLQSPTPGSHSSYNMVIGIYVLLDCFPYQYHQDSCSRLSVVYQVPVIVAGSLSINSHSDAL
ncbi:hypothetical protein PGT21_034470 [Puccinia graminis f. sp. tritici]|uniref:Uncharacterized protein n=1 Tax=Puccinia graminis f. sp. tritici TaxID=56615 RepID=A0A5B0MIV3_PUCGR|nr:hypothetical protein PGTUg99_035928 [Puccinia graminis f. sp. tritici]KAA1091474.1 hypothetical protein PGT21_034470 [Puccinia graminis f. sp. tritici]